MNTKVHTSTDAHVTHLRNFSQFEVLRNTKYLHAVIDNFLPDNVSFFKSIDYINQPGIERKGN